MTFAIDRTRFVTGKPGVSVNCSPVVRSKSSVSSSAVAPKLAGQGIVSEAKSSTKRSLSQRRLGSPSAGIGVDGEGEGHGIARG
jgi:hypothetical protein